MIYFCFFFLEKDEHAFHFNSLLHHLRSENFLSKYFSLNSLECSLSFPYFSNYSSCKFEIACFPANSYLLLSTLINSSCHILCIFVLIYINVNAAISKMGSRLTFQLLFNLPIHEFGEHGGIYMCVGVDVHIFALKAKYLQIDIPAGLVTGIFCVEVTCEHNAQ